MKAQLKNKPRYYNLLPQFQRLYPKTFKQIIPLKIGIKQDILKDKKNKLTYRVVDNFLRSYTQTPQYCQALITQKRRIDLEGNLSPIKNTHLIDAKKRLNKEKQFRTKPLNHTKIYIPNTCSVWAKKAKGGLIINRSLKSKEIQILPNKWLLFYVLFADNPIQVKMKPKFFKKLLDIMENEKQVMLVGKLNVHKSCLLPFDKYIHCRSVNKRL